MQDATDHYTALGLKPTATPAQIKQAYHRIAKHAHPDTGGNPEVMQRINVAYQTLSDPQARHRYDEQRAEAAAHPAEAFGDASQLGSHPQQYLPGFYREHHRLRKSQARASGWRLIQSSILAAILLNLITQFFAAQTTDQTARLPLALIGFVPVYTLALGIVFLINPQLRLDLHDLRRGDLSLTKHHLAALVGLAVAFIPLAVIWITIFS
jgi:hypothetical protein